MSVIKDKFDLFKLHISEIYTDVKKVGSGEYRILIPNTAQKGDSQKFFSNSASALPRPMRAF